MIIKKARLCMIFLASIMLLGCGDNVQERIDAQITYNKDQMSRLSTAIDSNSIRNSLLLKEYARLLKQQQSDLALIADQVALDATTRGPIYQSLLRRNQNASEQANMFENPEQRLTELRNIFLAADPGSFGDALSDPINVLADLSKGTLARINAASKEETLKANQSQDFGPGSQMIGNPAYGQWSTGNDGLSFWEWYGMYALLDNVLDGGFGKRRVYYNQWGSKRGYSYYHDYGRNRYTSPKSLKAQDALDTRTKKQFSKSGQYKSPYAKARAGSNRLTSVSKSAPSSGQSKFRTKNSKFSSKSFKESSRKKSLFSKSSSKFRSKKGFKRFKFKRR